MFKKVIITLGALALLTACTKKEEAVVEVEQPREVVGTYLKAQVVNKDIDELSITVQQDGREVELFAHSEDSFDVFSGGDVVTIGHNENNYIETIKFEEEE
jgi:hypothetical protein